MVQPGHHTLRPCIYRIGKAHQDGFFIATCWYHTGTAPYLPHESYYLKHRLRASTKRHCIAESEGGMGRVGNGGFASRGGFSGARAHPAARPTSSSSMLETNTILVVDLW